MVLLLPVLPWYLSWLLTNSKRTPLQPSAQQLFPCWVVFWWLSFPVHQSWSVSILAGQWQVLRLLYWLWLPIMSLVTPRRSFIMRFSSSDRPLVTLLALLSWLRSRHQRIGEASDYPRQRKRNETNLNINLGILGFCLANALIIVLLLVLYFMMIRENKRRLANLPENETDVYLDLTDKQDKNFIYKL